MDAISYLDKIEEKRVRKTLRQLEASADEGEHNQGETQGHTCVVCETPISPTFTLCKQCEQQFGPQKSAWPEWLKFLEADAVAERRRFNEETGFGLVDYDEEEAGVPLEEAGEPVSFAEPHFGHGTTTGYRKGCRCEACREANCAHVREWRECNAVLVV